MRKSTANVECPACKKTLPSKGIPKHVSGCPSWDQKIGIPPSEFNFNAYFKRDLYADGLVEGADYVKCQICLGEGKDFRFKRMMDHLKKVHDVSEAEYKAVHPGAQVRISSTAKARKKTVQARYGVDNVFQAEEVKASGRRTMIRKYGAPSTLQVPEIREKAAATNMIRYGSENPFGSEEIKEKIKATNKARYGSENVGNSPIIVARRVNTNMIKYGSPVPQGFGLERKTHPEELIDRLTPKNVVYTGDRSYWIRCVGSDGIPKNRNPDFVVYTPENLARVEAGEPVNEVRTNKVIEVLGDYWHREEIVGLPRDAYVASRAAEYASVDIACLIIWESEVEKDSESVQERLTRFLSEA